MEEENLEILNHNRVRLVEKVDTLVYVLRQRSKTVKDVTMALYEFMVREELQLKLQRQSEAFQEAGEHALAKEYSQVYRILIELFDKFVELLGDEKVLSDSCKDKISARTLSLYLPVTDGSFLLQTYPCRAL